MIEYFGEDGFGVSSRLPSESCLLFSDAYGPLKTALLHPCWVHLLCLPVFLLPPAGSWPAYFSQHCKPLEEKNKINPIRKGAGKDGEEGESGVVTKDRAQLMSQCCWHHTGGWMGFFASPIPSPKSPAQQHGSPPWPWGCSVPPCCHPSCASIIALPECCTSVAAISCWKSACGLRCPENKVYRQSGPQLAHVEF